jgi:hypothetical protein
MAWAGKYQYQCGVYTSLDIWFTVYSEWMPNYTYFCETFRLLMKIVYVSVLYTDTTKIQGE